MVNPFLVGKFWYEVAQERTSGLEYFNVTMGRMLGITPFHTIDSKVLRKERFGRFANAIAHHMYDGSSIGLSDCLNVSYGLVFSNVFDLCPSSFWLVELILKDFRKPDYKQLYLEKVPFSEYGDLESPDYILNYLRTERLEGRLRFHHEAPSFPIGVVTFGMETILESAVSERWRGLKERLIGDVRDNTVSDNFLSESYLMQHTLENKPGWLIGRCFEQLFEGDTAMNWDIALRRLQHLQGSTFLKFVGMELAGMASNDPEIAKHLSTYFGSIDGQNATNFLERALDGFAGKLDWGKLFQS